MASQLAGKSYLVTGSTDGIGRHTAEKLSRAGAHVIIHGRNATKVEDVAKSLTAAGGHITGVTADMADFKQVRRLAAEVKNALGDKPLNVLLNNAGVFEKQRSTTADGLEMTFGVNVAAPYLLTSLLLDIISDRIVNVASISAASSIDFGNLQQASQEKFLISVKHPSAKSTKLFCTNDDLLIWLN